MQHFTYRRNYFDFKTREVKIGLSAIGGDNPIRIQSMTTTNTMDTIATAEQCLRLVKAGCEYVRITAPSIQSAQNLANIKKELQGRGCHVPLIADIHYTPKAAEIAARIVEKVRINPGNYADKKKFQVKSYSELEYLAELERIRASFLPFIRICKEEGTAIRIGTNHGSLSDRIMNRYGDTSEGMVESAMEFVRICSEEGVHNIVLSMKASNPAIMIEANLMLVEKMIAENMNYPLHLGVTEAGDGISGRVKSAIGIGTLLSKGIGNTIRVSLTENPEEEIPFASILAKKNNNPVTCGGFQLEECQIPNKRISRQVQKIGGKNPAVVISDLNKFDKVHPTDFIEAGYVFNPSSEEWSTVGPPSDVIYVGKYVPEFKIPDSVHVICDYSAWKSAGNPENCFPLINAAEYLNLKENKHDLIMVKTYPEDVTTELINNIDEDIASVLLVCSRNNEDIVKLNTVFKLLTEAGCNVPLIIGNSYSGLNSEEYIAYAASDMGDILLNNHVDGLFIQQGDCCSTQFARNIAFSILQATRLRIYGTDYISCPSCGRTLFDLQKTTAIIKKRTGHLKGLKIGIMGCIVNGPGEMADADYGYVGTGHGLITLYRGKVVMKRNVPETDAVNELINLIKEQGDWVD